MERARRGDVLRAAKLRRPARHGSPLPPAREWRDQRRRVRVSRTQKHEREHDGSRRPELHRGHRLQLPHRHHARARRVLRARAQCRAVCRALSGRGLPGHLYRQAQQQRRHHHAFAHDRRHDLQLQLQDRRAVAGVAGRRGLFARAEKSRVQSEHGRLDELACERGHRRLAGRGRSGGEHRGHRGQ